MTGQNDTALRRAAVDVRANANIAAAGADLHNVTIYDAELAGVGFVDLREGGHDARIHHGTRLELRFAVIKPRRRDHDKLSLSRLRRFRQVDAAGSNCAAVIGSGRDNDTEAAAILISGDAVEHVITAD